MQKGLRNLSTMFYIFSVDYQPEEILYICAGNALDVLVALNFGFIFIYVHFLKACCYIEAIK